MRQTGTMLRGVIEPPLGSSIIVNWLRTKESAMRIAHSTSVRTFLDAADLVLAAFWFSI